MRLASVCLGCSHYVGQQTGRPLRADEMPEGDVRKQCPRTQPGDFEKNMRFAHEVEKTAEGKGCFVGQIALAWLRYHSGKLGFLEIIAVLGATTSAKVEEHKQSGFFHRCGVHGNDSTRCKVRYR